MFVNQEMLIKRAARLMNQDNSVKTETIKLCEKTAIKWYDETQVCRIVENNIKFYVGEIHMRCDAFPDRWSPKGFKNWLWVFGINSDGTLEIWAN